MIVPTKRNDFNEPYYKAFLGRAAASMNGDGAGAAAAGGMVCSFGEHDCILSRRDINDTLKNSKNYF